MNLSAVLTIASLYLFQYSTVAQIRIGFTLKEYSFFEGDGQVELTVEVFSGTLGLPVSVSVVASNNTATGMQQG